MSSVLSQREIEDLLSALSSGELEKSTPVRHPKMWETRTKIKTFWFLHGDVVISAITSVVISSTFTLLLSKYIRRNK